VTNHEALKSAARAAIVMPAVFAFADQVIGNPQTSIFAAFGSFAVLVLVEFGGLPRTRLIAYLVFAASGVVLITVGTLCSRDAWLAAGATGVVGFVTLFSGAFNGYLAAASTGAILLFVLPANIPAPNSAIPDRLLGFALAAGVGTVAALLLWPPRRRADLRRLVAAAMRTVVELIDAEPAERRASAAAAARAAVDGLRRSFLGSQHRPAGPTGGTAALAALPDELDWLLSFLEPPLEITSPEESEAMASAAAVLRAGIDRLDGGSAQADFDRLERGREDVARAFIRQLPELPPSADTAVLPEILETPFRVRAATYAARQVGLYAMRATDGNVPSDEDTDLAAPKRGSFDAVRQLVLEHASTRSVWLQNSIRGAVALALATYIAQRATLQHGFWVVLGTLSVLRSNALGTGSTIARALAGTAVGIVAGALLVIVIGTHRAALWAVLPLAVFLAAYAPRAISFLAGQAGFTITLLVLFNIIQPVGWQVGVVRVEDVAIGFAVSLVVGLLFWPRGAAALLRSDLANAFARSADYVAATMHELALAGPASETARTARAADAALHRLDDVFRQYLVERAATRMNVEDAASLVSGAARVRRAAQSLVALQGVMGGSGRLDVCGRHIEAELDALHAWYVAFGDALVHQGVVPPPHPRDRDGRRELLECASVAARGGEKASKHAALILLLAVQHLDNLRRLEAHLGELANAARPTGRHQTATRPSSTVIGAPFR
jgi:uncharacterized membrane protein YccC